MNHSDPIESSLRVLIVEDNPADLELLLQQLRREHLNVDVRTAQTEHEFREQLALGVDIILSDYHLPAFSAPLAMSIHREMGFDIPFIVVTGSISEEVAVECMKRGASDYLLKDRLTRLGAAIKQAMAAKKGRDERRHAEHSRDAAMRELDHRVRNNLAAVLALLDLSSRKNPASAQFAATFRGRTEALAVAHDMLRDQQWLGADLESLVRRNLNKIMEKADGRLTINGPSVQLPSRAVNAISLSLHELAVNAATFGAWSVPGGIVEISWTLSENDDFELSWQERDGPTVPAAPQSGTGLRLVEDLVKYEAGGHVDVTFSPSGLHARIFIPGQQLLKTSA